MLSNSLSTRLLIAVSALLIVFFGATTAVLDRVFRESSLQAINDRMDVEALALMAASEETIDGDQLTPSRQLLDTRYLGPNSGLYGQVWSGKPSTTWKSPSLLGTSLTFDTAVKPAARTYSERTMANGARVLTLSVGVTWEFSDGKSRDLVFSVAEGMEQYYTQLQQFRMRLFGGFAVLSLLLLIALGIVFRRVLRPLRRIEHEIGGIEAGERAELSAGYPRELIGVTENMNALLRSERERMARYRKSLGNLAHSLKTPLAVMRNLLATGELRGSPAMQQLDEQLGRVDDIVRYQLKRAAASAGLALGSAPIPLHEVVEPLVATLRKVYFERHMACDVTIEANCAFLGDKGDLMELVGNLLDNAFKYGHEQVRIAVKNLSVEGSRRSGLELIVEDDGPGIDSDKHEQVLKRGTRLDERPIGQGIGLSVVSELTELYRGSVTIDRSSLGGARLTVRLRAD
jgi:two-component system, OmpR family, sensor histidine kinase PhoQ